MNCCHAHIMITVLKKTIIWGARRVNPIDLPPAPAAQPRACTQLKLFANHLANQKWPNNVHAHS